MGLRWYVHGDSMEFLYNIAMGFQRDSCGISTIILWYFHGVTVGFLFFLLDFYGISLWSLCYLHSCPWFFYGFISVGCSWYFYDFSTGSLLDFTWKINRNQLKINWNQWKVNWKSIEINWKSIENKLKSI